MVSATTEKGKTMSNNTGKQYTRTSFRNGGRKAGMGINYDDYSEESSGRGRMCESVMVRFSTDNIKPEDLNGPCVIVQKGRKKDENK
jgi:hypothetical protein